MSYRDNRLRHFVTPTPEFPVDDKGTLDVVASVRSVVRVESYALVQLQDRIDEQTKVIQSVCTVIRDRCQEDLPGRLIMCGIGKAGKIADKLSATFASTGTPSHFLHPAEARHGDLGIVSRHDVVMVLSFSGESEEVLNLIPSLRRIGALVVALVGRKDSRLASHADHVLWIGNIAEACPLGMAPSASTTALLALGDALALTIQQMRGFTPAQYARFHPGGALGRRLTTCGEVMRTGERVPYVDPDSSILTCLHTITRVRAGLVIVVDNTGKALGLFTDGDLRRILTDAADPKAALSAPITTYMRTEFTFIDAQALVETALGMCARTKVNALPVLDAERKVLGLIDLKDLIDRGFSSG